MTQEELLTQLGWRLTDLCNRYLNAVDDLGVIDRKKRAKNTTAILDARDALLHYWVPIYAAELWDSFIPEHDTQPRKNPDESSA